MHYPRRTAAAFAVLLSLAIPISGDRAPSDRPSLDRETPGPIRYMLELEVLDPDGAHVLLDGGTFDTAALAVTEVERISRRGVCVLTDPVDPETAGICYPPARHLRTRLLRVWF